MTMSEKATCTALLDTLNQRTHWRYVRDRDIFGACYRLVFDSHSLKMIQLILALEENRVDCCPSFQAQDLVECLCKRRNLEEKKGGVCNSLSAN